MQRIRLLLVEDEEAFRTTLASRLRRRGFDVVDVESGYRALETAKKETFDVAIIDVEGMEGLETLREMKKISDLVEVIMLTEDASVESATEGMRLGAFDYMMKPFDIKDLAVKIEDAYTKKLIREAWL